MQFPQSATPLHPPTREEQHQKKLQDASTYLKKAGWRSTNDYILDHYNTPSFASQSLRLQPQSTSYAPTANIAKTRDFPAPVPAKPMASWPSNTFSASLSC